MKRLLAGLLLAVPVLAGAETITIGSTAFYIPAPEGYAIVTPQMEAVGEVLAPGVPENYAGFAWFIPAEGAEEALAGGVPALDRRFSVQTLKEYIDRPVSNMEYTVFKFAFGAATAKEQNQVQKGGEEGEDFQLLKPHEETRNSFAFSTINHFVSKGESGESVHYTVTATVGALHVKGRLLMLAAYGGADDLEWTRAQVKAWTQRVQEINPLDAGSALSQSVPFPMPDIDWGRVGPIALSVLGLWGLAALGIWFAVRSRKQGAGR